MLVWVRTFMESWVARVLFALLVAMFIFWGISNVLTLPGGATSVAYVAGKPVNVAAVEVIYQRLLGQAEQQAQQPDKAQRQQIAMQALSSVLRQQVMVQTAQQYGIGVPNAAVREILYKIPAFQTNGVFSKDKFAEVLKQNNISQLAFIDQIKAEIIGRQLISPLISGAAVPPEMTAKIFTLLSEQRTANAVDVSVNAQPLPPAPSDAVLYRYWLNHQSLFTAPEYRKVQLVILSPALLAPQEIVPQAQIDAGVQQAQAASTIQPTRSAEILSVQDLADASRLQAAWQRGASWQHMQELAKRYHAQPVPVNNVQQDQIPAPALAAALFSARLGKIVGPIAGDQGMYVFKVTGIYPDHAQFVAQVKQQLQLQMAQDQVAKNVDALQDALAGQTPLNQLPGNLGLVAVEGTLDAGGLTQAGTPAPIPGGDDLRNTIIKAVFAASVGQSMQLQTGPDGSYYALNLEAIIPPAARPFAQAKPMVLNIWQRQQQAREAEVIAADLLHAVNTGKTLTAAAAAQGLKATPTPAYTREAQPSDQPARLVPILFTLKLGQATMLSSADGFLVAELAHITHPSAQDDPATYAALQQSLNKTVQDDLGDSFLQGLQKQENVKVNEKLFAQIYQ